MTSTKPFAVGDIVDDPNTLPIGVVVDASPPYLGWTLTDAGWKLFASDMPEVDGQLADPFKLDGPRRIISLPSAVPVLDWQVETFNVMYQVGRRFASAAVSRHEYHPDRPEGREWSAYCYVSGSDPFTGWFATADEAKAAVAEFIGGLA